MKGWSSLASLSVAILAASSWSAAGPPDDGRTVRGRAAIPGSQHAREVVVTARWGLAPQHIETTRVADGAFVFRGLPVDADVALEAATDPADMSGPPLEGATTVSAGRDAGSVTVHLAPHVWGYAGFGWNCGPDGCERRPCDDCTRQHDAWSVIYYLDDRAAWVAKTAATTDGCEHVKVTLASTPGVSHLGACNRVGDVLGPASAFDRSLLDPGDTWYCPRGGADGCSRSRSECTRQSSEPCSSVNVAFATTSLNVFGKEGSSIHVYRDAAACIAGRRAFDADAYQLSACTRVGPIERAPVDPTTVPQGNGWYCYSRGPYGWCWRDQAACESSQVVETEPTTKCSFVERAFVSQYGGDTSVFPTLATCKAWLDEFPTSTKCEQRS